MRLIDADAFVKELEIWHRNALAEKAELNAFFSSNFIDMVNMMPTVDAVPVIRCKDCKHMGDVYLVSLPWLEQKEHRCRYWEHPTTPDDYCNRAERKKE